MLIPLNEEVFRREETTRIDAEFRKIIKFVKENDIKTLASTDLNTRFGSELKAIETLIFKLFNAKIIFKFDDASNPRVLSYGMMIFPSMQELKGKIRDAVEKEKEGFYLRSCTNVLVVMDLGVLTLIKKEDFNERHLTAILLHELGHKVYVRSQNDIRVRGSENQFLLSILGITVTVSIPVLPVILPFIFLAGIYGMLQYNATNTYVQSEHLSDLTAVKYGYGTETYQLMDSFYRLTQRKKDTKIKALKVMLNILNSSKMRRDEVEKAIKKELNDSKNSPTEKKLLKNALEEINKIKN